MATTIKVRRDTAANWTSVNPVLNSGEIGLETDTRYFKIGDGATAWASLAYSGRMDGSGDLDMGNNSINNLLSLNKILFMSQYADAGDGSLANPWTATDDFAQAVTDASNQGKVLVIDKGYFEVNAGLALPSDFTLIIQGYLKLADSATGYQDLIYNDDVANGNSNIRIIGQGGVLDGNKANNSAGSGIKFKNVSDVLVANLKIVNPYTYGVAVVMTDVAFDTENIQIDNVVVENSGANSFLVGVDTYGMTNNPHIWHVEVNNCISKNSGADGIEMVGISGITVNNFQAYNAAECGISQDAANSDGTAWTLWNNIFLYNCTRGVESSGAYGNDRKLTINNLQLYNCGGTGNVAAWNVGTIDINNLVIVSNGNPVRGVYINSACNHFRLSGGYITGHTDQSIYLSANVTDVIITNVRAQDPTGILEVSGCDYNTYTNNNFRGCTTALSTVGANDIIANNQS